ncbi:phosphoadenylyl-sulfate reductase [Inquilinus limosus]|uniref:phosphoadenylyl-sulfate reductase n=1 Tax=Inquilinus limosus TaxID=171674 RepID=UPI0004016AA0|nr:phosphoadenylyl-sulfate reductase [Inquilinus limosus]
MPLSAAVFQELIAAEFDGLEGHALIERALADPRLGPVALVSSFGAESAVLLALVAEVAPATPVIFLDTLRHFGETLRYRDKLVAQLGLEDVRSVRPDPAEIAKRDPDLLLFQRDPDACCALRKVEPLERALAGFGGWITGRKRFQAATRAVLPAVEWAAAEGRFKINPLAGWSPDRIAAEFDSRGLPHHPLEADGFLSIGCMPCTERVAPGADPRSGRWSGQAKTECGIHRSADPATSPVTFL